MSLLEYIFQGFINLLDPVLILFILLALLGGIIVGSLPGFSPTMGVALLVPFTYTLLPIEGLTILAAIYTGAVYGGSISAILLNIPGAPANIATLLDGYPMAQKGEGRRALLASAFSSAHGGIISAICLIIFAPLLSIVALRFGPPEKFWIAILGLVIIAGLGSGKKMIKGLFAGIFGVWLGTIGISPTTGEPRFTFGIAELWGGIDIIPALVGLFAFSQVLKYFESIIQKGPEKNIFMPKERGQIYNLYKEIWAKYSFLTIYSGILGSLIGVIPGAGGQVGGIVAYDHAKRFSKNGAKFGTGQIEGVIAPETANNATVGGAIIPLLTLGIPGSPTSAVLIGGLLIHGLWPGPLLFTVNAEITYTFMAAFFVSQFALLLVAITFLSYASNIMKIKEYYLGPVIIALCIFGSFAVNNNFFDIYIMIFMGILGYLFLKMYIPPEPLVLGLILGPIAEENFLIGARIGLARDGLWEYFFLSPISIVFITVILAIIASTVIKEIKYNKQNKTTNSLLQENQNGQRKGFISNDTILGIVILFFALYTWVTYLTGLSKEASIFPIAVMIVTGTIGLTQIVYASFVHSDEVQRLPWKLLIEVAFIIILAVYLANVVGFYTVTFFIVYYMGYRMICIGGHIVVKDAINMLIFSMSAVGFLYFIFQVVLYLPTPKGLLF